MNVSHHSPLMRALHHASYTFEKRLSHTADSQDQRHRMVPASRPLMTFVDTVRARLRHAAAHRRQPARRARSFDRAMRDAWNAKNRLLALGVPHEFALYVLPNAKALRLVESGSLLALCTSGRCAPASTRRKRSTSRRWTSSTQLRRVHPRIGRYIGPPCVIRNGLISPRCTEGSHFCGVPVWRDFPERRAAVCDRPESPDRIRNPQSAIGMSPLIIVFVTVFIDLLGFGIIIPADAVLCDALRRVGIQVGMLATSFSLMQFLFAPLWGRWSDVIGRRPVILIGLWVGHFLPDVRPGSVARPVVRLALPGGHRRRKHPDGAGLHRRFDDAREPREGYGDGGSGVRARVHLWPGARRVSEPVGISGARFFRRRAVVPELRGGAGAAARIATR